MCAFSCCRRGASSAATAAVEAVFFGVSGSKKQRQKQGSKKAMLVPALPALPAVDAYARCLEQPGERQQRTGAAVRPFQRHWHQREQRGAEQARGDRRVPPNPGGDPEGRKTAVKTSHQHNIGQI